MLEDGPEARTIYPRPADLHDATCIRRDSCSDNMWVRRVGVYGNGNTGLCMVWQEEAIVSRELLKAYWEEEGQ